MQNPDLLDLSTVVSLVPFEINETKPGLIPGSFIIPPSTNNEIQILHVTEAIFFVYIDEQRGSMKITTPSYKVAASIVEDYLTAQLGVDPDVHPAVFWVRGKLTALEVQLRHGDQITSAHESQNRWFDKLIMLADDDWEKTRQHMTISDTQRHAARARGQNRPWLIKPADAPVKFKICPSCASSVPEAAVLCPICKLVLDPERHKELVYG